jgi:hypothetical protein
LHLLGVLDDPRGAQDLKSNHAPVLAEVGDNTRADFVALSDRRIPLVNMQEIGFAIVGHLQVHHYVLFMFRYFAICDAL